MSSARAQRKKKASAADRRRPLDSFVWKACAGNIVKIPAVGSRVLYLPQGHLEQSSTAPDFSAVSRSKPYVLCRVAAVQFLADQETDEVFAKISLDPRAETLNEMEIFAVAAEQDVGGVGDGEAAAAFSKILTPSDVNNRGTFCVPRRCADSIFQDPDVNIEMPFQTRLVIRDLLGNVWNFRHFCGGKPPQHLLTSGWNKFVDAKKLVAGDGLVFIRSSSGDVFVGIRRRFCGGVNLVSNAVRSDKGFARDGRVRVSAAAVVEAVRAAEAADRVFEVEYYPRNRAAEFVVAEEAFKAAVKVPWEAGIKVKMAVAIDVCRIRWHHGTVDATVLALEGPWARSPWRMLKMKWENPEPALSIQNVSPWQVELISGIPQIEPSDLVAGERGVSLSSVDESVNMVMGSLLPPLFNHNASASAGMQGARQDPKNNDQPSHSGNMTGSDSVQEFTNAYPGGSSPTSTIPYVNLLPPSKESYYDTCIPAKRRRSVSIQLFGQVIQTEESSSETDAVAVKKKHRGAGTTCVEDHSSAPLGGAPESDFRT